MSDLDIEFDERCDECHVAQACVKTFIVSGGSSLSWCKHHYEQRADQLINFPMVDHRDRLMPARPRRIPIRS